MSVNPGEHRVSSSVEYRSGFGSFSTRPLYDGRLDCPDCRPHRIRREVGRFIEAFQGKQMFVDVIHCDDRRKVARHLKTAGVQWGPVPIYGDHLVILATAPWSPNSVEVTDNHREFLTDTVFPARWGPGAIRGSKGFLPPARDPGKTPYFEAYSETGRCWHAHPTEAAARRCARRTGHRTTGTCRGWYVRPTSGVRRLGSFTRTSELVATVNRLGILHFWEGTDDQPALRLQAMAWDDPRFEQLRLAAGWRPPRGANWRPPDIDVQMHVTLNTGAAEFEKGAA